MEKETDQENQMVKFDADAINFVLEEIKECVGQG